jgi:predicted dehydrogenase
VAELAEFAAAIREGRDPAISGEDGLPTLQIIDAVFESARVGKPVSLTALAKS